MHDLWECATNLIVDSRSCNVNKGNGEQMAPKQAGVNECMMALNDRALAKKRVC